MAFLVTSSSTWLAVSVAACAVATTVISGGKIVKYNSITHHDSIDFISITTIIEE